jgi:hypothetical protein
LSAWLTQLLETWQNKSEENRKGNEKTEELPAMDDEFKM